ncbi:DUF5723 family protein [uncultured Polaribacter sp.]|uniref:DUF5723 family protein n=1 Tax=uncultured Polaribacter sp. TaxID=174711 RepID=UPI00261C9F7E|nr:DUF5723 family protein [uncultured Polaribacter sp.]
MKKTVILFILFTNSFYLQAQSYLGFLTDNYSGVNSVISNPANITDSRFKTDIHLSGLSGFFSNDYYGVNLLDASKEDYDFDLDAKKTPSIDNNAIINIDVMGPAFMFNLNKNSSIAIFTRVRSMVNINEINGTIVDDLDDDTTSDFNINEGDFGMFTQAWAEFGVTYARVLLNNNEHFLKGGLTLKYLRGGASAFAVGKNITVNYDEDGTNLGGGQTTGIISSNGKITYGRFDDFDKNNYNYELPDAKGLGGDLGFVYEWRPNFALDTIANVKEELFTLKHINKYKLKIGLSITDIGSINYNKGFLDTYNISSIGINEDDFNNADDIDDILSTFYTLEKTSQGITANLPTALHLNADWSFTNNLYVNLNTDISLISKGKENASRISNIATLTPRFESKWLSFYLPLSIIENSGFKAGAGLRMGPLYVGSGSVLTALTSNNIKGVDVYAGLKIPVYQGKIKDKDGDGVIDKLDCNPRLAGPIENNGCPWGDKDQDNILDNEDECPEKQGAIENNGCPWGDKDQDGVLNNEDVCPEVFGFIENSGCPWKDSDNDGIFDKDDKCIDVPGAKANNGCPEEPIIIPTTEIQKKLNVFEKNILFDSGKSTIKVVSMGVLNEIVKILRKYPNTKFSIEAHTDSIGKEISNQKLSEFRATVVKDYLVEKGVSSSRLIATGFGERKPIASNTSKAGRSKNRRVEIKLIK